MSNIVIDFDKPVAQLRAYRDDSMDNDRESISGGHKQEAAYQMVSLLLGMQRFFNSPDFDDEYIREKLFTLDRIIQAYMHDKRLNLENWVKRT